MRRIRLDTWVLIGLFGNGGAERDPIVRAEIEKYQERDPIKVFTNQLKEADLISDTDIAEIEAQVKEDVAQAVKFADESPLPDPEELYTDIYASPIN